MGEVYRARDTRLDRTVAVKILPAHLSSSAELKARFEREARTVSSLNHPHICQLYDIGSQDGTAFLVMEFLEGESLAERLRKGPLPLKQALEFGVQIAEALATAHRAGILHRDLKPGNVMLTATGAKLLDFGLAKTSPTLAGPAAAAISGMTPSTPTMSIAELSAPSQGLTQRGTLVGTFQYMAPEVLRGAEADARSDIFSLGCVLYELVTGRRPFEGKSQLSVLTAILEKDPDPVSQVQKTSPLALDHLVKTCLEKNPEERLQTAQDVKLQLKWIAEGGARATEPGAPSGIAARLGWIVAGMVMVGAVALCGAYLKLTSRPAPVVRSSILPPAGAAFVTQVPASGPAVISHDGTRLAFIARDDKGKVLLYVRSLTSMTPLALPGTDDATYPFWSPDGREIGFFAQGKLKRVSASGGPAQALCDAPAGRGGAWNKDGVILFTPTTQGALFRVPATGGTPVPVSKIDAAHRENSHRWPSFLPDNQHFIFWARTLLGGNEEAILAGSLNSQKTKKIVEGVTTATYVAGHLLYTREQTLMAQPFDTQTLELTGEAVPIAEHVALNGATGVPEFSASENGTLVYQTGEAGAAWDLIWFGRDGKRIGTAAEQDRYFYPTLSPDNSFLAFALFNGNMGLSDVWTMDLKRGTKSRLTFGPNAHNSAVWSYDGKLIYYSANVKGAFHIYSKAADESGPEQLVQEDPAAIEVVTAASPDGRYLVYLRRLVDDPNGNFDIWAVPLSGDHKPFPVVQSPFDDRNPSVSPNSKWMAYQNNESGRTEVYITSFPGGGARWQVSTSGGSDATWRGDGKELYFLDPLDNVTAVDVDTSSPAPRLGVPHALFQAVGIQRSVVGTYTVTKDGKRFLLNSGLARQGTEPLTLVQNWTAELRK